MRPQECERLQEVLDSGLLHYEGHRLIGKRLLSLYQRYKTADLILLHDSLNEQELKSVGGSSYLASLVTGLPDKPSFDALAAALRDASKRRSYQELSERLAVSLSRGDATETLDSLYVAATASRAEPVAAPTIEEAAEAAAKGLDEIRNKGVSLHFGIRKLDDTLGGIRTKKLYTIGGRTSQGKTTVCANIIHENLVNNKEAKIYYNGFENVDELPIRLAAIHSDVKLSSFIKPHEITEEEYGSTLLALSDLAQYKDRLIISFGDSISQMRQVCRSYKPDIVFVDYIQRLSHKYELGSSDRLSHAIGKAISDLQDIAIDSNCAVFCCSQFRRASGEFRGKEPCIEDLKESGDIENESDNIILLWWPWRETLDDKRYIQNQYRLLVRKNKLGPTGDVYGTINLETLKITDW